MEFIKLSQEVVDISKKLESISKKLVKVYIDSHNVPIPTLQSSYRVKSKPSDLPPAGIIHQQTTLMWQKSLRKRN